MGVASQDDMTACAQHAVAAWARENVDLCQVIHGHEWGGVLVDAATIVYFRRLRQGTRSVVTPHGGHMWSMQWKPQRSFSVEPLRIDHQVRTPHTCNNVPTPQLIPWDPAGAWIARRSLLHMAMQVYGSNPIEHLAIYLIRVHLHLRKRQQALGFVLYNHLTPCCVQERMVNLMADTMASPTAYMQAYFRQRGWRLPEDTLTIPNVMPAFQKESATLHPSEDVRQVSQACEESHICDHPLWDQDAESACGIDTLAAAPLHFLSRESVLIWRRHVNTGVVICRRVWRVAFFSRLEERKGIKVFVDALQKLDYAALSRSQVRLLCSILQVFQSKCSHYARHPFVGVACIKRGG